MTEVHPMTLRLESLDHLFVPNTDMYSPSHGVVSGIDHLASELRARPPKGRIQTTIMLPESEIEPGSDQRVRLAVIRHCESRIIQNDNELSGLKRAGMRALWVGIVGLFLGLGLSEVINRSSLPEDFKILFGQGFVVVVAWVAIWYPLDVFLHYTWPYRRERRMLKAIMEMDIVIERVD